MQQKENFYLACEVSYNDTSTLRINHWSTLSFGYVIFEFITVNQIIIIGYTSSLTWDSDLHTQLLLKEFILIQLYVLPSEVLIALEKAWGRSPNKYFIDDGRNKEEEEGEGEWRRRMFTLLTLFWLMNERAVCCHASILHISFKLFSKHIIPFSITKCITCAWRLPEFLFIYNFWKL